MNNRLDEIAAIQRSFYGVTLYDAIMAVADVCDLDNEELDQLEADLLMGPRARVVTLIEGELV